MKRIEYRILWSDDGSGQPSWGDWAPLDWAFDHQREAEKNAGDPPSGLGKIHVGHATCVEFRRQP